MEVANNNNISLRYLSSEDAERLASLGNNPNIFRFVSDNFPNPYSIKDAQQFIKKTLNQTPVSIFAIEWKGIYVGNIGLHPKEGLERKSVEIGYFVGEEYWNNGIATQAINLICEFGFNELDINRISASVIDGNISSQKALEKCGFKKEGVLIQALYKLNEFHDDIRYYKLKPS